MTRVDTRVGLILFFGLDLTRRSAEVVDREKCKLTQNGADYEGKLKHTVSKIPCMRWDEHFPHWPDPTIRDRDFIDGSKGEAQNYCRNPQERFNTPWCYTTSKNVSDDECSIPLCSSECRITITGSEYSGPEDSTLTNRKCVHWSEKVYRSYANKTDVKTSKRVLDDKKFPDGSRKKAEDRCRNPTGDVNGPWCFVQEIVDGKKVYKKEYCEIAFCSIDTSNDCYFATTSLYQSKVHNHFIKLQVPDEEYFRISTLLWNASAFNTAEERIAFVASPFLLSGENLKKLDVGIEVFVSNMEVTFVSYKDEEWLQHSPTPKTLLGTKNMTFYAQWLPKQRIITFEWGEDITNLHLRKADYESQTRESILSYKNYSLSYYSVIGHAAIWSYPCPRERACEEHRTLSPIGSFYKKMSRKSRDIKGLPTDVIEFQFFVRSKNTVIIEYRFSPIEKYPYFRVEILGEFNKTTISFFPKEGYFPIYLASVTIDSILGDWFWSHFSISMYGEHLSLVWWRQTAAIETVFDVSHPMIRNAVWYTFSSIGEAYWLLNCSLSELPNLTKPEEECSRSKIALDYSGVMSTAFDGQQCLPWIFYPVIQVTRDFEFKDGSRMNALNYCRNPNKDSNGAYCYVVDQKVLPALQLKKMYCNVPTCLKNECRLSGIGLEYDGLANTSRSNRTCNLSSFLPPNTTERGFCRNPNHNVFGPWCNTTDLTQDSDLCLLPDCDVDDAYVFFTSSTQVLSRRFMVHPTWMVTKFEFKTKIWDPTQDNGIKMNIMVFDVAATYFYTLAIGVKNSSHIELLYVPYNNMTFLTETPVLLKTKIAPKLIPKGFWQGFWIKLPPNSIEFGYEGSQSALFSWTLPNDTKLPISPVTKTQYVSFTSLATSRENFIGYNFPPSYCLIEETSSYVNDAYYPINLWRQSSHLTNTLILHLKAKSLSGDPISPQSYFASMEIHLYKVQPDIAQLIISINYTTLALIEPSTRTIVKARVTSEPLLRHDRWTSLEIRFVKNLLTLSYQLGLLLEHTFVKNTLIFYYFSVHGVNEVVTWLANCPAPHINQEINGGWSEWSEFTCSAPCGGGFGFRTRTCDSPRPSYQGYPCLGLAVEDGACNQFDCGCLNPATLYWANKSVHQKAENKRADEFSMITLSCNTDLLIRSKNDSPGSYVQWLKDGFKLPDTHFKLGSVESLSLIDLSLEKIKKEDTGVYMCVIYSDCRARATEFVIFTVIALTVRDHTPYYVRETRPLRLACNSATLQYVSPKLSAAWYVNDFLFKNYTDAFMSETNYDVVRKTQRYHEGIWECRVFHQTLGLTWVTNWINVKVQSEPNLYTYLTEDDAPKLIFGGWPPLLVAGFLIMLVVFEMTAIIYIVYWFWKTQKKMLTLSPSNK